MSPAATQDSTSDWRGKGAQVTEAEKAEVEERWRFFRIGADKSNLAPPETDQTWRQLVSVNLPNGDDDELGDSVGVVTAWRWPDPLDEVSVEHLRQVQKRLAVAPEAGHPWRADSQAKHWAGRVVMDVLDLDPESKAAKARAKRLIELWVSNKVLKYSMWPDPKGRERKIVEVGEWVD